MLSPTIAAVMAAIERLPLDQQDQLAAMIAADLADLRLAAQVEAGTLPAPLDQLIAQAEADIERGDSIDLDAWLSQTP